MNNLNIYTNKKFRYTVMVFGILIYVIGINLFLTPAKLLSGGVAGISILLNFIFNINPGIVTAIVNIPIFIIGYKYFNKEFLVLSFINMLIFSVVLGLTQEIYTLMPIHDVLLQSIFGGLFTGIGLGLIFKAEASSGGLDIVSGVFKRKFNIPLKNTFLFFNMIIVGLGGIFFGIDLAMYTLISIYISSTVMEITKNSFTDKKSLFIISEKHNEISEKIMKELHRGVTFLDAQGAYTKNKKQIIYCIISSNELMKIKDIVYEIDDKAFISINTVEEVRGNGFRNAFL